MDVISAIPLTDSQRERLIAKLELESGGKVILKETVDPSILGGLIVRALGRQKDGSLASKLAAIEKSISDTIV